MKNRVIKALFVVLALFMTFSPAVEARRWRHHRPHWNRRYYRHRYRPHGLNFALPLFGAIAMSSALKSNTNDTQELVNAINQNTNNVQSLNKNDKEIEKAIKSVKDSQKEIVDRMDKIIEDLKNLTDYQKEMDKELEELNKKVK